MRAAFTELKGLWPCVAEARNSFNPGSCALPGAVSNTLARTEHCQATSVTRIARPRFDLFLRIPGNSVRQLLQRRGVSRRLLDPRLALQDQGLARAFMAVNAASIFWKK